MHAHATVSSYDKYTLVVVSLYNKVGLTTHAAGQYLLVLMGPFLAGIRHSCLLCQLCLSHCV